ncbi:putative glycoside hydrolase, partial [Photobacterium sp. OFAV2-7]|uniref:putative glycoside hydrolase n=1 Tax=Photobacterium sp. OFAV2-7 TaxID=2917748 RepID=UPI002104DA9C
NDVLPAVSDEWTTMKFALSCFADEGMEFSMLNTPFLLTTSGEMAFDLGEVRYVPRSLDKATDEVDCAALAVPALPALDEDISYTWSDTWSPSVGVWTAHTGSDWSPAPDHVATATEVDSEGTTVVNVAFNAASPADDKAVIFLTGKTQNLTNYVESGKLEFDLLVTSYGDNRDGLVIKMESSEENASSPDYFLEKIETGKWTAISVPVSDLAIGGIAETVNKPFAILPAWGNSQAGVEFSFKNVRLVK